MSRDRLDRTDTVSSAASSSISLEAEHDPNISRRTSVAALRQIQRKLGGGDASENAHDAAARGVSSPTTSLPFADQIQSSFGSGHDVSNIQAHVGGDSASAMGASAYATGNHVVFDRTPDLHTAAHEAAHVVQQAQGVNLYGGVGDAGDSYEKHADAVADRVVAGQSASDLLGGRGSGMSTSTLVVQRKETKADKAAKQAHLDQVGPITAYTMAIILKDSNAGIREMREMDARSEFYKPLEDLLTLSIGHRNGGFAIPGREKREIWDRMAPILSPMLAYANNDSTADMDLQAHWDAKHNEVVASSTSDRVDNAMMVHRNGKDEAIEIPDDSQPKEQAEVLKSVVPEILKTSQDMLDRAKTLGEQLAEEDSKIVEGLDNAVHVLTVLNGYLKLTDAEFQKELNKPKNLANRIANYTELVKTSIEMTGHATQLMMSLGGLLMKAVGEHEMATAIGEASKTLGKGLGYVVAGFEVVHGLMTVFDSSKTRQERIDGGVEAGMGLAVIGTGESLYALPIGGPYAMVKVAAYLYREAVVGWEVGFLKELFSWMGEQGGHIAREGEALEVAHQLAAKETDPVAKRAMQAEETKRAATLGTSVDNFLDRCTMGDQANHGVGHEFLDHYPGNFGPVGEVFAPLLSLRGAKTGPEAAKAAARVLDGIKWCFQHGDSLARGSAAKLNLAEIKVAEAKEIAEAKKKKEEEKE
jgi:hypothetical protein